MPTSGIEQDAEQLLLAFYELSGSKLNETVSVGGRESNEAEAAAPRAGLDPASVGCETAVRYLADRGYIEQSGGESSYKITVPGIDRVKEIRGVDQG